MLSFIFIIINLFRFSVEVSSSYRLLLNDQKTRLFASLSVKEDAHRTLHRIVAQVDRCLQLFNQQTYYQVSIPSAIDGSIYLPTNLPTSLSTYLST